MLRFIPIILAEPSCYQCFSCGFISLNDRVSSFNSRSMCQLSFIINAVLSYRVPKLSTAFLDTGIHVVMRGKMTALTVQMFQKKKKDDDENFPYCCQASLACWLFSPCASLGEGMAAIPVINHCMQQRPDFNILMTTTTLSALWVVTKKDTDNLWFLFEFHLFMCWFWSCYYAVKWSRISFLSGCCIRYLIWVFNCECLTLLISQNKMSLMALALLYL